MRTALLGLVAILATGSAKTPTAAAAPCTTATTACERWIIIGKGPARTKVYASYPLDVPNAAITRALIMVHGAGRNADHYFETSVAAGFLAGALDNTVIIAPRFAAGNDKVADNEVLWPERGGNWRSGGALPTNPSFGSFDLVDEILRSLANKKVFPNLTKIVVTGHSAGGQFATRYEMANKMHDKLGGVAVSYVVANPSSYAWPAAVRPLPTGNADPASADKEALGPNGEKVNGNFTYGPFDATKAPAYDKWPAGLENRTGYTAAMSDDQLRKQLAERPTTYLLGQVDVLPLGGFDSSPNAMAQGPTRRARGEAFFKYVTETLGAKQTAIIVPECGHNDRCIYTTDIVFPVIFPK
ncbi:MAG: alpha/beta fold hydrolase [Gemmatimonadaceae bacterium]